MMKKYVNTFNCNVVIYLIYIIIHKNFKNSYKLAIRKFADRNNVLFF